MPSRPVLGFRQHLGLARFSPGAEESALFDRFVDLIVLSPKEYDRIIFDTAPTGHTLRLLTLPTLLTAWVEGMVRQREKTAGMERMLRNLAGREGSDEDPVLQRLRERRERFRRVRRRLLEDANFYLVLIPERLPIEETARTLRTLTENGIAVGDWWSTASSPTSPREASCAPGSSSSPST